MFSTAFVRAQDTASLTGTVIDPTGAVVAGAQVAVTNAEHGINRTTVTNSAGDYAAPALPAPSSYDVTVTAEGFKKFVAKGVILDVARKARVDVTLQVGATGTEVTVEGTTVAQVETQSSDLGSTVSGKEISQPGYVSYLDVVDAQRTELTNERASAQLFAQRLTTDVALIKALGGGWSSRRVE